MNQNIGVISRKHDRCTKVLVAGMGFVRVTEAQHRYYQLGRVRNILITYTTDINAHYLVRIFSKVKVKLSLCLTN
jgi:hypothetical protein